MIIHRENTFEDYLLNYLDLEDEPEDPRAIKVVEMPEKGGAGAVAARRLQFGDPVARARPVAMLPNQGYLWRTPYGQNIRQQAIHHLPLPTRAAIARLYGRGETADEFLSDMIHLNTFDTTIGPHEEFYAAIVLEESRVNHACRPNLAYHMDAGAQILHITATKLIEPGEELTISYRSTEELHGIRRQSLKDSYGFDCSCAHCQMSDDMKDQSDLRIFRLQQLEKKYHSPERSPSIQDVQKFLELCENESLMWCRVTSNTAAAEFHNSRGSMTKVKEHALVAKQFAQLIAGNQWSRLGPMEMLLEAPEKHESHFLNHQV